MRTQVTPRWKHKNDRAVSPIIATILLVAITVVLAAVLYVLVTGLIGGGSKTTNTIGLGADSQGTCASSVPTTYSTYTFQVASVSGTITTSQFGLAVQTAAKASVTGGTSAAGTGTCAAIPTGGYIIVLQNIASGAVADTWAPGTSTTAWVNGGQTVTAQDQFVVIQLTTVSMTGDSLTSFPLGTAGGITLTGGGF